MILHIVLFQPKASATPEELGELARAVEAASREIPSIRNVRVGRAIDFGFGYQNWPSDQKTGSLAIFEFGDRGGLESYLAHPTHRHLSELFWKIGNRPIILDAVAVDPRTDTLDGLFG